MSYYEYLKSDQWKEIRKQVFRRCQGKCERCGVRDMKHVHHLTYRNLYEEELHDLQGLCEKCHRYVHGLETQDPARMPTWEELYQMVLEM